MIFQAIWLPHGPTPSPPLHVASVPHRGPHLTYALLHGSWSMELLRQVTLSGGGPRFEARAFAAMHPLPFVVRSAEFANVDGVLDCKTACWRKHSAIVTADCDTRHD